MATNLPQRSVDDNDPQLHVDDHNILHAAVNDLSSKVNVSTNDARLSDAREPLVGSVSTDKIANGAVALEKLDGTFVANLVFSSDSRLSDQRVPVDGSVTSNKLANGSVTTDRIAANQVTMGKLASDVTAAIAAGGGGSGSIVDGSVTQAKLDPTYEATLIKSGNAALTNQRVPTDNSVSTIKLVDANVTTVKIADGNVTQTKLDPTFEATLVKTSNTTLTGAAQKSANLSDLANAATARTNLGLGNVSNTSDAAKPVSTATQTALDSKAPTASPTFTGTVNGAAATFTGTVFVNGTVDVGSSLGLKADKANNLSDLASPATARTNLGLGTAAVLAAPTGTLVGTTDTQTLANKTLTTPVIASVVNTGTITFPTATDTLVGRTTTDTLTNKTLTSPAFTGTPTGLTKTHVGLANVDNTSNATERTTAATLTNKRITRRVITLTAGVAYTPLVTQPT